MTLKVKYFKRKFGDHFERPYGWAWILKLQAELEKNAQVLMNIRLKDAKKCGWPPVIFARYWKRAFLNIWFLWRKQEAGGQKSFALFPHILPPFSMDSSPGFDLFHVFPTTIFYLSMPCPVFFEKWSVAIPPKDAGNLGLKHP